MFRKAEPDGLMAMSKIKVGLSLVVVAGAAALIFLQYQTQQKLRAENDPLHQQMAQLKSGDQEALAANSKPGARTACL